MPIDPLSGTTRNAKRNLLVAAIVAITYRAFDISIEKIPVAGIMIDFNKGAFSFLIILILIYFVSIFSLYYLIDIRSFEETLHQRQSQSTHISAERGRIERFLAQAQNRISRKIKAPLKVRFTDAASATVQAYLNSSSAQRTEILLSLVPEHLYNLENSDSPWDPIADLSKHEISYETLNSFVIDLIPKIVAFERSSAALENARFTGVKSLYAFRNYGLDGLLPITLGTIALLAMYKVIPMQWLQVLAPNN